MSIESFSPLPLNVFGTWVTPLDPSDVPVGMLPSLGDAEFFPEGVRRRPGLVSQFPVLAGTPQINGVKTYASTNLIQRFRALDSLGDLYKESTPGATLMPGCHRQSPNAVAAGSRHWAGRATTRGCTTASACTQIKNSSPPRAKAENRLRMFCAGPGLTGTHHKSIAR